MELLTQETDYIKTIQIAEELKGEYNNNIYFHCYWSGKLNEKHLISIKSCYYYNVMNKHNRKIILWIQNNKNTNDDEVVINIKKYAIIINFEMNKIIKDTFLDHIRIKVSNTIQYYSDFIRNVLLYKYGGCWFDLDIFFLRSLDPIFTNYENKIIVYQWCFENYPNNALYISLKPNNKELEDNIRFIIDRNKGWGFQQAKITFDLSLNYLVLPCSWFDGGWIENIYNTSFYTFFKQTDNIYNLNEFFKGSFCFHWHNKWNDVIEINSQCDILNKQLNDILNN